MSNASRFWAKKKDLAAFERVEARPMASPSVRFSRFNEDAEEETRIREAARRGFSRVSSMSWSSARVKLPGAASDAYNAYRKRFSRAGGDSVQPVAAVAPPDTRLPPRGPRG